MKRDDGDTLVRAYLRRLRGALRPLGRRPRQELVDEIAQHIARARAELPQQDPAAVRAILETVGDPAVIAGEALGEPGSRPASGRSESWAIGLLLLGGFLLVVGWLVGVVLLWGSRVWRLPEKLVGTLLVPGGVASAVWAVMLAVGTSSGGGVCHGPTTFPSPPGGSPAQACHAAGAGGGVQVPGMILLALLVVVPILTAVYLDRRRRVLMAAWHPAS